MGMLDLERKKECEKERSKRERRERKTVKKYLFSNNTIEHNTHSDEIV